MKKFSGLIFILMILSGNSLSAMADYKQILPHTRLLQCKDYYKITPDNIKALKVLRYTEGGVSEKDIGDKKDIEKICRQFSRIQIAGESKMSCTDNTTIYAFTFNDGSKTSIELECNWAVINGKNYDLEYSR
ncbi:MAG: hypothetical protein K6C94_10225 [Candidatus Gastranaerophilales bacterium]|nr:hypothetical protein [Candidatus Gastranaerophilales bacterium]